ncbi:putative cyclase-domain-containing protein [Mucor mucedo]|uniref:putative cyclase-domain-containing protein n=1 Tax=Mucor mucedo TaxID=29922 RepID=UPI0022204CCF|nr:putative cyclase-domain-containing protein [Mucor mucedo]KAI7889104.1 putative cyclase-domain-containing protein [Mucor mucedo]
MTLPTFDQLPISPEYPPQTAWGVWGKEDNLGTLNLLTEERVANAAKYIKRGAVFSLNWNLESPSPALFGRTHIDHAYKAIAPNDLGFDDCYSNFNTQSSTQWDGLRHIAHLSSGLFYNGVKSSEIVKGNDETNGRLGIHHMARKGIAGRAVLLDYARWARVHKPDYDPFVRYEITVQDLDEIAKAQGVVFEQGDILLVHTGWLETYERHGDKVKELITDLENPDCAGIKACEDTFRWVWDHHFAAVGSDNFAFEAFPPKDWNKSCHSTFLGGFGLPIGEMFQLGALAEDSAKDGVYTYFFTSAPLNKQDGIATPPNALCIK